MPPGSSRPVPSPPSSWAPESRESSCRPELGDLQVEGPKTRLERAVAIAIAPSLAVSAALKAAGADHAVHISFHDDLQNALRHRAQEVGVPALRKQVGKR